MGKDRENSNDKGAPKDDFTAKDLIAFMIASFQLIVPAVLILMGVLIAFYFLVRFWAR